MHSTTQPRNPSLPVYTNEGLGSKKTALIIVTVIGCIAIIWPKVFYPMMFGGTPPKPNAMKEPQRGPGGLRQERPAHLHPESIYQAMRERGRAIPTTTTVPIVDRKGSPSNPPPRYVEGRPGPIPGMRPPMGAGALHQPQAKGNSMGFIMPIYTIGIIIFFGYTIMKIAFKKPIPNAPYGPAPTDPNFRKEVFGLEGRHVEDLNGSSLGSNSFANSKASTTIATTTNTATATTTTASTNAFTQDRNHHDQYHHHQNNHHHHHKNNHPYDPRNELYNASLSAATAASNLSTSLKQHQQQYQQRLQQQQQQPEFHQVDSSGSNEESSVAEAMSKVFNKETDQLMEIEKLRKKLEDTERAMAKLIAEMNSDQFEAKKSNNENSTSTNVENISNGHTTKEHKLEENEETKTVETIGDHQHHHQHQHHSNHHNNQNQNYTTETQPRKRRDGSTDRSVAVLGMEVTASCEGGRKWAGRPSTPDFCFHNEHSRDGVEYDNPEPQSIYLEGSLPHESQILIADSQIEREEVYDEDLNGTPEEPAVVLSSKMTLSLINLGSSLEKSEDDEEIDRIQKSKSSDIESPLADDIEIIGHVNETE